MASTRQEGVAWLLLCATVVALAAAPAQAQQTALFPGFPSYTYGQCPSYQSGADFNQAFIDQLTTVADGYILVLSDGSAESCQKIKFLDENTFKYSFNGVANRPRIYSSTYTATTANLSSPAQINLDLLAGMLGANIFGQLTLFPLVVDADKLVLASCTQLGGLKTEQLMVFMKYPSTANVTVIKQELVDSKIPNAGRLAEIGQECGPEGVRNTQPLPLRFYNLISSLNNPARPTQNSAGLTRIAGILPRNRVSQASFRSGLVVGETGNALSQPAQESVPFYTGNFEVPVFYNFQQPFVSTFASGYPVGVTYNAPQAPVYTAAAHGGDVSFNYQGKFPNDIYTKFYTQGK